MRLISTSKCMPGMRLGKTIYNEDGLPLLGASVELTQSIIHRLLQHGIGFVYIEDPRTADISIPEMIQPETRAKAMSEIRSNFRRLMEEGHRKKTGNPHQLGKSFRHVMSMIIDDISYNQDAMIMLMDMSTCDHYLYSHSLHVCIYSTMLGVASGYSRDELMAIGLGSLLHDIGKTQLPIHMLSKKGELTDLEAAEVRKHPEIGYLMLKDEANIPLLSAHCAYQHHERLNGSGYPRGIQGEEIHDYAQWIALVDTYDALTSHRAYRPAMLPHQAIEVLYAGTNTLFEQSKIELFRDKVALYPLGIAVTLQSGAQGIVVDTNQHHPQRPVIRVLTDEYGQELTIPYEVDLSKKMSLMIVSVNHQMIDDLAK